MPLAEKAQHNCFGGEFVSIWRAAARRAMSRKRDSGVTQSTIDLARPVAPPV